VGIRVCYDYQDCRCRASLSFALVGNDGRMIERLSFEVSAGGFRGRGYVDKNAHMIVVNADRVFLSNRVSVRDMLCGLLDYHRSLVKFAESLHDSVPAQLSFYLANLALCYPPDTGNIVVPYNALFDGCLIWCGRVWPKVVDRRIILSALMELGFPLDSVCSIVRRSIRQNRRTCNQGER
jgi:hypothetical protein